MEHEQSLEHLRFFSTSVGLEMNVNKIASHFGIQRKYKWEDVLVLKEPNLEGVISNPKDKAAYLFHFGSIVTVNMAPHEITDFYHYLAKIDGKIPHNPNFKFDDQYQLQIGPQEEERIENNMMTVSELENYHPHIIATVLARSAALDRVEESMEILIDDTEKIIELLDRGKLSYNDAHLSKTIARILRHQYSSISSIMVLDKPSITWNNAKAEKLYVQLEDLFDLPERYHILTQKTETLIKTAEIFTNLSHARRGALLEWGIIALITFDILLGLWDRFTY